MHFKHTHTHTQLAVPHWWRHLRQLRTACQGPLQIWPQERTSLFWQVWFGVAPPPAGEAVCKTRKARPEVPLCSGRHVLSQQSHAGESKALSRVSPVASKLSFVWVYYTLHSPDVASKLKSCLGYTILYTCPSTHYKASTAFLTCSVNFCVHLVLRLGNETTSFLNIILRFVAILIQFRM